MKAKIPAMSKMCTDSCNCSIATQSRRSSFDSLASYDSINTHQSEPMAIKPSSTGSILKSRSLSLRRPFLRRATAPASTDSRLSLPVSMPSSPASSNSSKSKGFFTSVPKMFSFELPFGGIRLSKASKMGPVMLSKRHRKPSTLDFRCRGTADGDEYRSSPQELNRGLNRLSPRPKFS